MVISWGLWIPFQDFNLPFIFALEIAVHFHRTIRFQDKAPLDSRNYFVQIVYCSEEDRILPLLICMNHFVINKMILCPRQ